MALHTSQALLSGPVLVAAAARGRCRVRAAAEPESQLGRRSLLQRSSSLLALGLCPSAAVAADTRAASGLAALFVAEDMPWPGPGLYKQRMLFPVRAVSLPSFVVSPPLSGLAGG